MGDLKFALNASGKTLTGGKNLVAATSATGSLSVELAGGTLSVQLGAFKATVPHTPGAATGAVVENLVQALNATGSPVKATASGDLISLVSKSTGTAANLAFTVTGDSKFVLSGSGKALTGGKAEVAATNATGSLSAGLKGGILSLQVGAFKAEALYAAGEPTGAVIQALVRAINVAGSPVRAAENGNVISLTSSSAGTAGNLALTVTGDARFAMVASGPALTGGKNATTTTNYDAGVVQLTTNGVTASATWAEGSTAETVAAALAGSVNQVAAAYYQASSSGAVVTLTPVSSKSSASTAANTSNPISLTVNDSAGFTPASFGAAMN
jgi:phage tail sheath gpL-like